MITLSVPRSLITESYEEIFSWCDATLGKQNWKWIHNWPDPVSFFQFENERNATLFALKWMNN